MVRNDRHAHSLGDPPTDTAAALEDPDAHELPDTMAISSELVSAKPSTDSSNAMSSGAEVGSVPNMNGPTVSVPALVSAPFKPFTFQS